MNPLQISLKKSLGVLFVLLVAVSFVASGAVLAQESTEYDAEISPDALYWQDDVLVYEDADLSQGDEVYFFATDENGDLGSLIRTIDVEETGPEGNPAVYIESGNIDEEELGSFVLRRPNGPDLVNFRIRNHTMSVSSNVENGVVSNTEDSDLSSTVEFDVDSDRTAYDLWISVDSQNLDQDALRQMFGDQGRVVNNENGVAMLNDNGNLVYGIEVTSEDTTVTADLDNMPVGEYDFRFYVKSSNVSESQSIRVLDVKNSEVSLNSNDYRTELGDTVPITVYFDEYNQATLTVENDNVTYSSNILLTEYDEPREVQLEFNTKSGTFELVGDQEDVDLTDQTVQESGPDKGEYTISTQLDESTSSSAPLFIEGKIKKITYSFENQNGDPVSAEMTFNGETKTGETVEYTVPKTDSELYSYTIEADGYTTVRGQLTVDSYVTETVTLDSSDTNYTILIVNDDGESVSGVDVSVSDQSKTTDSDGEATFNLEAGQTYDVELTGENISDRTTQITVNKENSSEEISVIQEYTYKVNLSSEGMDTVEGRIDINGEQYEIDDGSVSVTLPEGTYTAEVYANTGGSMSLVDTLEIDLTQDYTSDVVVENSQSNDESKDKKDSGPFTWFKDIWSGLFG